MLEHPPPAMTAHPFSESVSALAPDVARLISPLHPSITLLKSIKFILLPPFALFFNKNAESGHSPNF
jgi:hypothetical protein